MTRILYGVSGEGSGHSSRALEVGRHLQSLGHDIIMVSYDRGFRNLQPHFPAYEIEGLHIVSKDNRVRPLSTVTHNLRRAPLALHRLQGLRELFDNFDPEIVLTDFEPTTAWLARFRGIPLISLDNQHRMRYMHYESPRRLWLSRLLTETIIRAMVPCPQAALATTFYFGPVKNDRTWLFPPILRKEVLRCRPAAGNHVLVYVTGGFERLPGLLAQFSGTEFRVYGLDREDSEGNIHYRAFSTEGFLHDLASCRAVIATAGFTLISEALHLGKPYLAMPMRGQFEQQLNAICLEELGCGMNAGEVDAATIGRFFAMLPELSQRAAENAQQPVTEQTANQALWERLDSLLTELVGPSAMPARR